MKYCPRSERRITRRYASERAKNVPAAARPDWRGTWEIRKAQFVKAVWIRMMRDPSFQPLYAYFVPTDGIKWGELLAIGYEDTIPAGAELMTAERIPAAGKGEIAYWLERFAGRLPVIPTDL